MKDLEEVSRPMPSWRVQQTFVPMEAASRSFVALSRNAPSRFLRMTIRYEGAICGPTEVGPFIALPQH